MNKKFSTLMASVLLATAFSSSAWAADPFATTKTGENVALEASSQALVIKNEVVTKSGQSAANLLTAIGTSTATNVADNFKNLDGAVWNVEVIENATSAGVVRTYRFANKLTGEYLAYKLETDGSEETVATKLDQSGNKTWAVDGNGALYAFVPESGARKDSTYYLAMTDNGIRLKVIKGKPTATIRGAEKLSTNTLSTPVPMNAAVFNYIMGKNDGLLHFNGDKDVSSNETNILKDTKWTAVEYSSDDNSFALTNGETITGPNNDMTAGSDKKVINIDKKKYLIVDTLYQDKAAKQYFKLAVDTIPYEAYTKDAADGLKNKGTFNGDATKKGAVKRSTKQAAFTGTYTFTNDSIALNAVNVPKIGDEGLFFNNAAVTAEAVGEISNVKGDANNNAPGKGQIALRQLGNGVVLTVAGQSTEAATGWIVPMIQPYAKAASAGDAVIDTKAVVYSLQIAGQYANSLRATLDKGAYLISDSEDECGLSDIIDGSNVYAQWAFIEGAAGTYRIVNRATKAVYYTGAVSILKDENNKAVADTYVMGSDTVKIAKVDLSGANVVTEGKKQYDYSAAYYAGDATGLAQAFCLNPVSPFMSALAMQYSINNGDTTLILGDADEAPVWQLEKAASGTFGLEIEGLPQLKKATYRIFTEDAEDNKYYVQAVEGDDMILENANQFNDEAEGVTTFEFVTVTEGQYVVVGTTGGVVTKMTINPTPAKPQLEATPIDDLRTDLFTINKAEAGVYRTLTEEDGLLGNAAIYMENEPSRYLYENSQNIVANNGEGLNFLGIFNAFELDKNPTVYVDTAWVNREGNWKPQYMFGLNVTEVEATEGVPCTENGNHYDAEGNKTTADKCVHATPGTEGYKTGRYLMSLTDSVPAGVKNTPVKYDGFVRLAFIDATIYPGQDTIIVNNSKYTGTANAKNDTLKVADQALNPATFALLIKDQDTKSFYLETVKDKDAKAQYVRILNGVPVLTSSKEDAAIFNIEASELEATANEAIEATGVQVIGGQGAVTVQGAAGKVITVANVLGQTLANQVAASDNVTIAVPAGIVVVAVEGDATKVVVK